MYLSSAKPQLAIFYENAHKQIRKSTVFVHEGKYALFMTFSDDLRENEIDEKNYSYTVVKLLGEWLAQKKLKNVPINVFCGDWCMKRYLKIRNSESVEIQQDNSDDAIIQSEIQVARYYITKNLDCVYRYSNAVDDLKPMLSKEWLKMHNSKTIPNKFKYTALDALCAEYGISESTDYNDIIGKLRCRK